MFIPSRFASRAWRSLIHFPAGATQTRSSVNGQSTGFLFQAYCRYYQSRSARLSQCIPLTIFHSATREPRPWHSPGRWLVGRLESLSSSPESHVADACLQTSVKSHGNGRRFTVNYLILTQLLDVVPRTYYSFFQRQREKMWQKPFYLQGHRQRVPRPQCHRILNGILWGYIERVGTADSQRVPTWGIQHDSWERRKCDACIHFLYFSIMFWVCFFFLVKYWVLSPFTNPSNRTNPRREKSLLFDPQGATPYGFILNGPQAKKRLGTAVLHATHLLLSILTSEHL